MSHFQTNIPMNLKHQVDTLYLPEDNEKKIPYKYALVVVDVGTRLLDAEPMAGLESEDAVCGGYYKNIFTENIKEA